MQAESKCNRIYKKKTQMVTNSDKNSDRDSETGTANIQCQELTKTGTNHRA